MTKHILQSIALTALLLLLVFSLTRCGGKSSQPDPPIIIPHQVYVHLDWATKTPQGYLTYVYRGNPDSTKKTGCSLTKIAQTNKTKYDDLNVAKGVEYCYALTQFSSAYNAESAFSTVVNVTIP